jgi:hypothetical protein
VDLTGKLFRQHFYWVLGAVVAGVAVWLLLRRRAKARKLAAKGTQEID